MADIKLWLIEHRSLLITIVIIIFGGCWWWQSQHQEVTQTEVQLPQTSKKKGAVTKKERLTTAVVVDVQGAVKRPGIYHLSAQQRVYDALQQAGGTTDQAQLKGLNQAQKVKDQTQIYVPNKDEAPISSNTPSSNSTATGKGSGTDAKQVNLNTASLEDLQNVTGIGPKKAAAIIDYRQNNGTFSKVEDLSKVKGIGTKTVDSIKDQLCV
ncbi:helix-hairpin-helix domain-containing protein [Lactobacillus sp. DCY120]|uniref:Helix-hairpin-helix domain-containing protein n=1 Tax=Bombilactobacillus apium TaxID=2675299 RepID=A0A850QVA6_9LACO|nr:helix-hairpin-helix domain-containing protein [Bombilactobacillus apium]NVY95714.1 helix-hairpin-helix domain-containing protein [Bombilactobacillus apium]